MEIEIVEEKDCGSFEVILNHIRYEDDTYEWQVEIIWEDGAYPNRTYFDTYIEAEEEYRRWGN